MTDDDLVDLARTVERLAIETYTDNRAIVVLRSAVPALAHAIYERFLGCANELWNAGQPSPRTCAWCCMGPCAKGLNKKETP